MSNRDDGTVSRLDAETGDLVRSIPVGGDLSGIAFGAGAVWVANFLSGTVFRIDPRTNTVLRSISVGNGPEPVGFGAGSVWVGNTFDGTVSRIDPARNAVTAVVQVGTSPTGIAFEPQRVWVSDAYGKTLTVIDPSQNAVSREIGIGNLVSDVAVAGDKAVVAVRASGSAHRGGTFVVLDDQDERPIDPAYGGGIGVYDGLTAFKVAGGVEGNRIVADLAASLPTPTDGGRTYTFQLRRGIRYSTGSLIRPDDVRHSIERMYKLGSGYAVFDRLVGAAACADKPKTCDLSRGISVDPRAGTVTFHLSEPDPEFLYKLAFSGIVPASTPDRDLGRKPIPGTGPYLIASFRPRHEVRFVRNPRFHEWSKAAQPDGYPDEIVQRFSVPASKAVGMVERGEADLAGIPDAPLLRSVRTQHPSLLHTAASPVMFMVFLNTRVPPFDDIRVRKALNYAVDRRKIAALDSRAGTLACQLLPPSIPGYQRHCLYTLDPSPSGMWRAPDLARAKRLVAASGTKGMRVTVWWPEIEFSRAWAPEILSSLRRLGFRPRLKTVPSEQYRSVTGDSRNRAQIGWEVWGAFYPTATSFVTGSITCADFRTADPTSPNTPEFCDRRIDAEMRRARMLAATDPQAANALWERIDRELTDSAPVVPLFNREGKFVVSRRLGNFQSAGGAVLVTQLWVR